MRVLVISEDAEERMRATSALTLLDGAEVVETVSAKAARRTLREDGAGFDVLVVDGDLYPQGGFSFLYELRAAGELEGRPTPPALVMIARPQDRFLTDWSGANDLVMKPVDPFDVVSRVRGLAGEEGAASAPGPEVRPQDESGREVAETLGTDGNAGLAPNP